MLKEKRRRWVQVKLRLTPEEKSALEMDAKRSGLSKNEYMIRTLINRVGTSAITCERTYCGGSVDIHLKVGNQRIGYASCLFFKPQKEVQISSFYVIKPFQNFGIEEQLIQEIYDYAELKQADSIVVFPGAEPYCPTEWKLMDVQVAWYEQQGFEVDHYINGVTPCMIKNLSQENSV